MLPGTSTNATVLDSATRDRTRVLLLFSLSGRLHPRSTALGALDERRTILDVRAYGTAYAPAWLPFVLLVAIGWVLLRRVSTRSGSLLPASDDDFVPVPPPRSPSGNRRP